METKTEKYICITVLVVSLAVVVLTILSGEPLILECGVNTSC